MAMDDMLQVEEKTADLAKLEISKSESIEYADQLKSILQYVQRIQEVDVTGVEPLIHPFQGRSDSESSMNLRTDVVIPGLVNENQEPKILESAPSVVDRGYKVPRVMA